MPKVSIHGNQLTLPDDLREALTTVEDDSLEAEVVDEGILVRRSDAARREAGWADIETSRAGVRYVGRQPRPSAAEEEQDIADLLYTEKLARQAKREQQ